MSQKKRNAPRSPADVLKDLPATEELSDSERQAVNEHQVERARASLETARQGTAQRADTLQEALDLVQHSRDLEASRGRTNGLPEGAFALQRLLIAVLESMTPEQRAEVRRRLGA